MGAGHLAFAKTGDVEFRNMCLPAFIRLLLLVVAYLACITDGQSAYAQELASTPPPVPINSADVEIATLRAQLNEIRVYESQLLSTVHWALGIVGAAALALVGYNLFQSRFSYEQDKRNISGELGESLQAELARLGSDLESRIDERLSELKQDVQRTLAGQKAEITRSMEAVRENIDEMKYDMFSTEATRLLDAKNYSMLITMGMRMIEFQISETKEWRLEEALGFIRRGLENGGAVTNSEVVEIVRLLDKLPNEFTIDRDSIKQLLGQARRL